MHISTVIGKLKIGFVKILLAILTLGLMAPINESQAQQFGPQRLIHTANNGPKKVASADLDQDGDKDVLSLSFSNGSLAWYKNDGKGNFQTRSITRNISFGNDLDIADLNQDGYPDIVLGTMNEVTWYENNGNQQFTAHTIASVNNARVVRIADLDQDGNKDIIGAIEGNNEVVWYENQGSQNFKKHTLFGNISGFRDLAIVDMDKDQDLDLVYASYTNNTIAWLEDTGSLSFSKQVITSNAKGANSLEVKDINGDNNKDIASAPINDNTIAWYENKGNGRFKAHAIDNQAKGATDIKVVDLNADGYKDLLGANYDDDEIKVYLNDSNKGLTQDTVTTQVDGVMSVDAAELNGDNKKDVLSCSYNDFKVAWYENKGGVGDSGNLGSTTNNTVLKFDGKDDYIEIGQDKNQNQFDLKSKMTISAWVKFSQYQQNKGLVAKWFGRKAQASYILWLNKKGRLSFRIYDGNKKVTASAKKLHNDDNWHHVVGIADGSKLQLIIDGKVVDTSQSSYTQIASNPGQNLTIGNYANSHHFKGKINGVKIWDEIKSMREIAELKCGNHNQHTNGLKGYWKFAEGFGNKTMDQISSVQADLLPTGKGPKWIKDSINTDCKNNYCFKFNGSSDYLLVPQNQKSNTQLNITNRLTVSAWVKFSEKNQTNKGIVGKWNESKNKASYVLWLNRKGKLSFRIFSQNKKITASANKYHHDGKWHHVTGVADGQKVHLYIDGQKINTSQNTYNQISSNPSQPVTIGNYANKHHFAGLIDEVTIWSDSNANPKTIDYCSNLTGEEPNLIGHWNFDNIFNSNELIDLANGIKATINSSNGHGPKWMLNKNSVCSNKDEDSLNYSTSCSNHASQVHSFSQGLQVDSSPVKPIRSNPHQALGSPASDSFYSLGFHNNSLITLAFDSFMTGQLTVYEESWNSTNYIEKARIYVSEDQLNWQFVGIAHNQNNPKQTIHPYTFQLDSLRFKYVKVVDATDSSNFGSKADGFDLNAICAEEIAPIQTPNFSPACQYYGNEIIDYNQGTYKNGNSISTTRSNPENALGPPQLPVYSLGFQNTLAEKPYLIIGFEELMTGKLSIYEYNNHPLETADVYVSTDTSNWIYVGQAHNYTRAPNAYATTFDLDTLSYQYVKLVNTTNKKLWGSKGDGFDLLGICAQNLKKPEKTLNQGCLSIQHIFTNKNGDNTITKRFKLANDCNQGWSYSAFELKPGTKAISYTSSGQYMAKNTAKSPFHSIKFECNKSKCFKNGSSEWFQFTIGVKDTLNNTTVVKNKAGSNQSTVAFSKEESHNGENTGISDNKPNQPRKVNIYANPVKQGAQVTVEFSKPIEKFTKIQMVNSQGRIIREKQLQIGESQLKFKTSSLKKGLYLFKIPGYEPIKILVQ